MYYAGNDASKTYAIGILNTRFYELFIITRYDANVEIEIVFEAM